MQETEVFTNASPPSTQRNKEEILFRCEHFLCYARDENFSPSPPSTLVLLYCKFLIEIHAVQLDSVRMKGQPEAEGPSEESHIRQLQEYLWMENNKQKIRSTNSKQTATNSTNQ